MGWPDGPDGSDGRTGLTVNTEALENAKGLQIGGLLNPELNWGKTGRTCGIRTCNQRIKSPLSKYTPPLTNLDTIHVNQWLTEQTPILTLMQIDHI